MHLYVIVHEQEVNDELGWGVPSSIKVYGEIQEIKQMYAYRSVDGDPTVIPADLPAPSDDLLVHVCGSSLDVCIPKQLEALQRAGYNAKISSASIF